MSHDEGDGRLVRAVDAVETLVALRSVPGVSGAVVAEHVGTDGATTLLAYLTGPSTELHATSVRQHLAGQLPDYLIPTQLMVLDELPLTPDGDYDLAVLPIPAQEDHAADGFLPPRTPLEQQLADVMAEILGIERVGVHDNFFGLGGSSILATRLAARIRELFELEVSLQDVLAAPTVDELAALVDGADRAVAGKGR